MLISYIECCNSHHGILSKTPDECPRSNPTKPLLESDNFLKLQGPTDIYATLICYHFILVIFIVDPISRQIKHILKLVKAGKKKSKNTIAETTRPK